MPNPSIFVAPKKVRNRFSFTHYPSILYVLMVVNFGMTWANICKPTLLCCIFALRPVKKGDGAQMTQMRRMHADIFR